MNSSQCRDYLKSLQRFGIKLGLDNIGILLDALGNPQSSFPSIHVAGTNGKGSVSAMLARSLTLHGLKTGLYTSPHLTRIEERIRIDDGMISGAAFNRELSDVKSRVDGLLAEGRLRVSPTFFEVVTAVALAHFGREGVDVAVLETGMGGRFDATNIVTPVLSVITTISLDHQEHLGGTLAKIAFEKAGIIKKGVPVVTGVRKGAALRVIRKRARELRSPLVEAFGPGTVLSSELRRNGYRFRYESRNGAYAFRPSLQGIHQGENAAVVLRAAEVLGKVWRPLDPAKTIEGIESARWDGRLEAVSKSPLVILDGAHNIEGVEALSVYLRDVIRKPVILVFDAMRDKAIGEMTGRLFPLAKRIILTKIPTARAASPEEILGLGCADRKKISVEPDVARAFGEALRIAEKRTPVVVAGSLFLVGEIKRILEKS